MMVTGQLDSYSGGGYVFNLKGANKDLRFDLMLSHGLLLTRWNPNINKVVFKLIFLQKEIDNFAKSKMGK